MGNLSTSHVGKNKQKYFGCLGDYEGLAVIRPGQTTPLLIT
jgi:hypothetical protein